MTLARNRREFLKTTTKSALAGVVLPPCFSSVAAAQTKSANSRPRVGAIGVGGRGRGIAGQSRRFGDLVAIAEVDQNRAERARRDLSGGQADLYGDYRDLLQREDIDVVTIGTPDHWHTAICITALASGKDVYCEKPLTLTLEEGKLIRDAVRKTGRVLQVGTQQRSEMGNRFLMAVALAQQGRIGKIRRVTCAIGGGPQGGPFQTAEVPPHFNWDMWLGQAPEVEYIPQRCHGTFRWWYEYSGGKMTDWGAHHVDIAQWAIGMDHAGPTSVEPLAVDHPVPFVNGHPTADDQFNSATKFNVRCEFPGGVEVFIRDRAQDLGFDNGIMFEGEDGRFFVNRGKLTGGPAKALKDRPLDEDVLVKLRKGKPLGGHMENFFLCIQDRSQPVSDVETHHRALTTCHLANIAMRLGRTLRWDVKSEQIVGDDEANAWQAREPRRGYELPTV